MNTRKSLTTIGGLILSCLVIFIVGACSDKNIFTAELPFLSIGTADGEEAPVNIGVPAAGRSETFSIVSNGAWEVTKYGTSTDWVTVTPEESNINSEITITVAQNKSEQPRKLTLRFAVDGAQVKSLSISQLGYGPSIAVSPKLEEPLAAEGGDITFTVTTNDDAWSYTIESGVDWITEKKKTATTLTLTLAETTGTYPIPPRTANITFSLDDYSTTLEVVALIQEGKELTLEGYQVKRYGTKMWMIENLHETGADNNLGYAFSDPAKTALYGRLYTWNEAMTGISKATNAQNPYTWGSSGTDDAGNPYIMDGTAANSFNIQIQGACPDGWHVPNMNDWYDLVAAIKQEYNIPGNTLSDIANTKEGYIIRTARTTGLLPAPALTTWGFVGAYLRGSSPKSDDGLWNNGDREDGWAFYYGGNVSLGFAAGNYPLYKTLSAEIGFNILPGGRRTSAGTFEHEGQYSYHWTAFRLASDGSKNPLRMTIGSNNANFSNAAANPMDAMCLRCVANY